MKNNNNQEKKMILKKEKKTKQKKLKINEIMKRELFKVKCTKTITIEKLRDWANKYLKERYMKECKIEVNNNQDPDNFLIKIIRENKEKEIHVSLDKENEKDNEYNIIGVGTKDYFFGKTEMIVLSDLLEKDIELHRCSKIVLSYASKKDTGFIKKVKKM